VTARAAPRSPAAGWDCRTGQPWPSWRDPAGCRCWRARTRWARRRPASARCSAASWTPGRTGSWSGSAVPPPPTAVRVRSPRWGPGSSTPRGSRLRPPPAGGVTCLTDVTAPLLGPRGAAAVFGPQKGADRARTARLEAGLARLAELLGGDPAAPGAGAAGGTGYGLATAWGAVLTPGAAELSRLAGLDRALANADLVITGEGRFDATSLTGKTCGTVIAAAAAASVPAALVVGQITGAAPGAARVVTLAALAGGTAAAQASPRRWLRRAARQLAQDSAWA